MNWSHHYVIDWDKVQTLDDLKRIIAAMNISFGPEHKALESIGDLVRKEQVPPPTFTMD